MPYSMTPVIATRVLRRTRPDNVISEITVDIGTPTRVPEGSSPPNAWYCTARILGFQLLDQEVFVTYGASSVDALSFVLSLVGGILEGLPFANEISSFNLPNFGFPIIPPPVGGAVLSGTVTLENCNNPAQNVTFEFRPKPSGTPTVLKHVLTPTGVNTGTFKLEGIPNGTYDLAIKAYSWLRKVIPNVVVNGSNISGLNVTLLGGDVNNTNAVDVGDLTQVIGHYNRLGDP